MGREGPLQREETTLDSKFPKHLKEITFNPKEAALNQNYFWHGASLVAQLAKNPPAMHYIFDILLPFAEQEWGLQSNFKLLIEHKGIYKIWKKHIWVVRYKFQPQDMQMLIFLFLSFLFSHDPLSAP